MVTSWNWIYLADFASYKPTYIPEDNPADFSFFFDSAGRRICYLAPERFYANTVPEGEITQEMDIFSVG
jgi:phosphoinositide-3-kinase regulatory subunit 4